MLTIRTVTPQFSVIMLFVYQSLPLLDILQLYVFIYLPFICLHALDVMLMWRTYFQMWNESNAK